MDVNEINENIYIIVIKYLRFIPHPYNSKREKREYNIQFNILIYK